MRKAGTCTCASPASPSTCKCPASSRFLQEKYEGCLQTTAQRDENEVSGPHHWAPEPPPPAPQFPDSMFRKQQKLKIRKKACALQGPKHFPGPSSARWVCKPHPRFPGPHTEAQLSRTGLTLGPPPGSKSIWSPCCNSFTGMASGIPTTAQTSPNFQPDTLAPNRPLQSHPRATRLRSPKQAVCVLTPPHTGCDFRPVSSWIKQR